MIPTKKVEQLVDKHQSLEKELSSGDIDKRDFAIKSKEYSSLGTIIQCAREYLNFENQKKELDKMINEQNIDKEMNELAQSELMQLIENNEKNEKILIIDDLIATGGTANAAVQLVELSGGKVSGFIFVINLFDLGGQDELKKKSYFIQSLINFPGH